MANHPMSFCWYELVTTDVAAAEKFYAEVVGWTMRDSGMPGIRYTLAAVGEHRVAGMMEMPEACAQNGGPGWLGYVAVPDVDAKAAELAAAGGKVLRPADDIPGIGRFAVVADPQGAGFVLFAGQGEPPPAPPAGTPGLVGWHELHATDWEVAFGFYARLFGWTKGDAIPLGPSSTYQLFATGAEPEGMNALGAMMNEPGSPGWQYYLCVEDIDAAASRLKAAGGSQFYDPMAVPGDRWVVGARDPQGATFSLLGPRR